MAEDTRHSQPSDTTRTALYSAGFNAHSQLDSASTSDIRTFKRLDSNAGAVLFAGWSQTLLHTPRGLIMDGYACRHEQVEWRRSRTGPATSPPKTVLTAFGEDMLLGLVDEEHQLWSAGFLPHSRSSALTLASTEGSPPLSHVALCGNGRVAVAFRQAPNARLTHVEEFSSHTSFLAWYTDPSGVDNYPKAHHMLPGKAEQLVANATTFTLRSDCGAVYTWGDPRHGTLARGVADVPADAAGMVDALGGLKMAKIAVGGWMSAALSEDGALYVWGCATPGTEDGLALLDQRPSGEEVVLVTLPPAAVEPVDVIDVAVGTDHITAVLQDGRLFVVGCNSNGQLGIGGAQTFYREWMEVSGLASVRSVVCGPRSTFVSASE